MSLRSTTMKSRKRFATGLVAGVAALSLAACTSNDSGGDDDDDASGGTSAAAAGSNDESGDKVVIGFSAPAADHGWMGSITESAKKEAAKYDDVELRVAEGTNDVDRPDQPGRDLHQRQGRRDRAAALRRRRDDADRPQGDGGRHPGHQRRPRVRRPERRPRHRPR